MQTKDEMAHKLASVHYAIEPGMIKIFRILGTPEAETRPHEPVKLLEVNDWTVPSGIMPLRFGPVPDNGFYFPSIIVEITPEEFAKLESQELVLPAGWLLGDLLPKAAQNGVG